MRFLKISELSVQSRLHTARILELGQHNLAITKQDLRETRESRETRVRVVSRRDRVDYYSRKPMLVPAPSAFKIVGELRDCMCKRETDRAVLLQFKLFFPHNVLLIYY